MRQKRIIEECPICGNGFLLSAANARLATQENSLTKLPDHGRAEIQCPRCEAWFGDNERYGRLFR